MWIFFEDQSLDTIMMALEQIIHGEKHSNSFLSCLPE